MSPKFIVMASGAVRSLQILVICGIFATSGSAQTMLGKPAAIKRVEPGLEDAVKWEWHVVPSDDNNWGLQPPDPTPAPSPKVAVLPLSETRPALYEVKRGDALILIGKKFGITVSELKAANGLKDNMIRAGQILKIPTPAEVSAMTPPPNKRKPAETAASKLSPEVGIQLDKLRLQIFLDREQFSAGPIASEPGPTFARLLLLYQSTHEDAKDDASLAAKSLASVANVFTQYKLKAEDFRFIAPPRAEAAVTKPTPVPAHGLGSAPGKRSARPGKPVSRFPALSVTPLSYKQMTEMPMLAYRSPWEFVAERFHCQESYLRTLNDKLPALPGIGAEFRVPNVVPFEIENALDQPLQPQADPNNPVTATVLGLSQLNIYQGGALIAVLPLSPARPGLHGRNSWTILDAIPRPRLATFQKERKTQTQKAGAPFANTSPEPAPSASESVLPTEQYIAAGPRNPVGILWINLAKAKSTEPLPYGLHGTSIPDRMNLEESIGGFRLTNWDIARAVRHLPSGTPLDWK